MDNGKIDSIPLDQAFRAPRQPTASAKMASPKIQTSHRQEGSWQTHLRRSRYENELQVRISFPQLPQQAGSIHFRHDNVRHAISTLPSNSSMISNARYRNRPHAPCNPAFQAYACRHGEPLLHPLPAERLPNCGQVEIITFSGDLWSGRSSNNGPADA